MRIVRRCERTGALTDMTMEKIKVRRQAKKHIYVHNDLSNAAYHFKKKVNERLAKNDREGISFDILAELIFLAFTMEAKINFLGNRLVAEWNERDRFWAKLKRVLKHMELDLDFNTRPYSTIKTLKDLRDSLAHGKPLHLELDEEAIVDENETDEFLNLSADWQSYCTGEFANQAYEDVNEIWKLLLSASKLSLFETLSGGEQSVTFIEKIIDQEP
jgi:hypothetical protein